MGFQQRPPRRVPQCPWCDQEMAPSPDSRGGRLFCPTGEAVEYRISGGRWYFNGRILGLEEPVPPPPDDGAAQAAMDEVLALPERPRASTRPDPLDAFRKIASDAWGDDDAAESGKP